MMIKTERTKSSRVYTDPRINILGERVERVWEDPFDPVSDKEAVVIR